MKLRKRTDQSLQDRLIWQAASLLLAYPDQGHASRLETVERLIDHITGEAAELLGQTLAGLQSRRGMAAEADYVDTFDLRKKSTMLLTFWTAGDTRNRGAKMIEFTQAYRAAGVEPPKHEAPDHLPVVLEFAATVDARAGRALLEAHRVPIDVLRQALADSGSVYGPAVTAVCTTLPDGADVAAHRLLISGPPTESVGLQPFQLTVPPRRVQGGV